jgi:hypothetical protein
VLLHFIPIILVVFVCKRNTLLASGSILQKIISYFISEWKYTWYTILSVSILLQYFIVLIPKHVLPSACNINLTCFPIHKLVSEIKYVFRLATIHICSLTEVECFLISGFQFLVRKRIVQSNCCLTAKVLPTFMGTGCHVVSKTNPQGH